MVEIEINGQKIEAHSGSMIIEVADSAGITIPRFCYHKKLSIAANCRMCLVEVDKIRKPVPACATPITEGMKVYTQSPMALEAQRAVMEFLLINHPLDCPICDQGGECELQDLAMGYGDDISQYNLGKRVINDKNIGPLISTDLTRCIQCTRCVRFGDEIAGVRELGMINRGENEMITTYLNKTVDSELSGNVIDICPVGALTSKPYRYTARPWELIQMETIAPHDCVGSNIYAHKRGQRVMRVVPKDNESINETWLSDRDRYSYQGIYSKDRLQTPMMKDDRGHWQAVDWETALNRVVNGLTFVLQNNTPQDIGALITSNATLEEFYLLQKLMRALGSDNIDHRLRQHDFSDQASMPLSTASAATMADISTANNIVLIGSNIRKEQPMIAHRIRMASLNGAIVNVINPMDYDFAFNIAVKSIIKPSEFPKALAGIVKALFEIRKEKIPNDLKDISSSENDKAIAQSLSTGEKKIICVGALALNHKNAATLRVLSNELARLSTAKIVWLYEGGNSVGAWIAGAVPHRKTGGIKVENSGLNAVEMLNKGLKAYLLVGIEPEIDAAFGETAKATLSQADFVVSLTCYDTPAMRDYADVLLPMSAFTETSGTYINFSGLWQAFTGVTAPVGESRPAWKVLRVLGNLLQLPSFTYDSSDQVAEKVKTLLEPSSISQETEFKLNFSEEVPAKRVGDNYPFERIAEVPMYSVDATVRRGTALQETKDAQVKYIGINPEVAEELGLKENQEIKVSAVNNIAYSITLPVKFNKQLLPNTVWIPAGILETAALDAHSLIVLE